jgi:hypothetical protein
MKKITSDYLRYGTEKYTISMPQFDMHILHYFQKMFIQRKYLLLHFHVAYLSRIFAIARNKKITNYYFRFVTKMCIWKCILRNACIVWMCPCSPSMTQSVDTVLKFYEDAPFLAHSMTTLPGERVKTCVDVARHFRSQGPSHANYSKADVWNMCAWTKQADGRFGEIRWFSNFLILCVWYWWKFSVNCERSAIGGQFYNNAHN